MDSITALRLGIFGAIGAALTGCDPASSVEEGSIDVSSAQSADAPGEVSGAEAGSEQQPTKWFDGSSIKGHDVSMEISLPPAVTKTRRMEVEVSGAPAYTELKLALGDVVLPDCAEAATDQPCADINDWQDMATVVTDAYGRASVQALVPPTVNNNSQEVFAQVLSETPEGWIRSEIQAAPLMAPALQCDSAPELGDYVSPDGLRHADVFLVCTDAPAGGCATPEALNGDIWTPRAMFADAVGQPIRPDLEAQLLCHETAFADSCCYTIETFDAVKRAEELAALQPEPEPDPDPWGGGWGWYAGRPFTVCGEARAATTIAGEGWSSCEAFASELPLSAELANEWAEQAAAEHASVAAFARFQLELLSVGAPAWLLAGATSALADEIRHAELCYSQASKFAGHPVAPAPLALAGALDARNPAQILTDAILEGCIEETISAAHAQEAARICVDESLKAELTALAADEQRHAELSWRFVRWMLETHPELTDVALAAFKQTHRVAAPSSDNPALEAYGIVRQSTKMALRESVLRNVVNPAADQLLGRKAQAELYA